MSMWDHPFNDDRYRIPTFSRCRNDNISTQQQPRREIDGPQMDPDIEPAIELSFDVLPRDLSQGFVFGFDLEACDVYCGQPEPDFAMCKRAFCISFNAAGEVVLSGLTDLASITVQYGSQPAGLRRVFQWIL